MSTRLTSGRMTASRADPTGNSHPPAAADRFDSRPWRSDRLGSAESAPASVRAELANMALAEIGEAAVVRVDPHGIHDRGVRAPGTPAVRRAIRLADLHLVGPSYPILCDAHTNYATHDQCRHVTVAEALLGYTCGGAS